MTHITNEQRKAYGCRACSGCDGASHHWIYDPEPESEFGCKHCDANGNECENCLGDGIDPHDALRSARLGLSGDPDPCPTCDGEGVVEMKPMCPDCEEPEDYPDGTKCSCYESNREVLSVIYDPNGNALRIGEIVDRLNESDSLRNDVVALNRVIFDATQEIHTILNTLGSNEWDLRWCKSRLQDLVSRLVVSARNPED